MTGEAPTTWSMGDWCTAADVGAELSRPGARLRVVGADGSSCSRRAAHWRRPSIGEGDWGGRVGATGVVERPVRLCSTSVEVAMPRPHKKVYRLTCRYTLINNHSDRGAALLLEPFLPIEFLAPPPPQSMLSTRASTDWDSFGADRRRIYDRASFKGFDAREARGVVEGMQALKDEPRKKALKKARGRRQPYDQAPREDDRQPHGGLVSVS